MNILHLTGNDYLKYLNIKFKKKSFTCFKLKNMMPFISITVTVTPRKACGISGHFYMLDNHPVTKPAVNH